MLDIIILSDSSKKEVIKTINSILYQFIDFDISINILDCNKKIEYDDLIDDYKKIIKINNLEYSFDGNYGKAKQYALENVTGKYIMFINSGDVFTHPFGLDILYKKIKMEKLDMVYCNYLLKTNNGYLYLKDDLYTINSKIYRINFLKTNNIMFNKSKLNNSYSFNKLLLINDAKIDFIDQAFSIVKNDNHPNYLYELDYIDNYIDDTVFIINNYAHKMNSIVLNKLSLKALFYIYFYYLKNGKITINNSKIKVLIDTYLKNRLTKSKENKIKVSCVNENLLELLIDSTITFHDFIEKMRREYD